MEEASRMKAIVRGIKKDYRERETNGVSIYRRVDDLIKIYNQWGLGQHENSAKEKASSFPIGSSEETFWKNIPEVSKLIKAIAGCVSEKSIDTLFITKIVGLESYLAPMISCEGTLDPLKMAPQLELPLFGLDSPDGDNKPNEYN